MGNGVPEETLKHFREGQAKYWANKGKVVWVHKYEQTKMIPIGEYQKYISDGWKKGRK